MDPQQRLLLECAMQARPEAEEGTCAGVFVGISQQEFTRLLPASSSAFGATGAASSIASGRLSYAFGFQGQALSIDTACSSSLVAAHAGRESVLSGACSGALACGVNLTLTSALTEACASAGMLASDGRCKTLDAAADGYVRAEGCLALFLSPDGGGCGSVLLGSALNQDGRSSSLTAPHGPSQQAVILKAVRQAEVAPSSVVALHLHGTGTSLGDPVEVGSLAMLLQAPGRGAPLVVTAVKSALGHGESASGLTSLSLLLASHQRRVAVPTLHLRSINPHVRQTLKASKAQASWSCMRATAGAPAAAQGVCATSSFGFSGTNAHMLSRFEAVSAASQPAAVFTRTRCWPLRRLRADTWSSARRTNSSTAADWRRRSPIFC